MTARSRILWIIGIVFALLVLGQLLAILRWVIGLVVLVTVVAFVFRAFARDTE